MESDLFFPITALTVAMLLATLGFWFSVFALPHETPLEKGTTEDEMVGWHHWLNGYEFWASSRSWRWTGKPGVLQSTGSQSQTWLSNWTELNINYKLTLVVQMVKNPPAMRETWVWSLGWEDPLKEGTATHSSILVWRIPMDRGAKSWTWLSD